MYSNTADIGSYLRNGAYRIESILGQGGFGITYLADFTTLKTKVAIKEFFLSGYCVRSTIGNAIHPQSMPAEAYEQYKARFIEEAQTLAQFNHPGIVQVTDIFEENNTAYFVMKYAEGKSLAQLIRERGRIPEREAVNYITRAAEALRVVHRRNILHRDIKPHNILVGEDGNVVLIDFGTARAFADGQTITHTTLLTPGFAPMEQYSGRQKRGAYTDIYALGATLYNCLSGKAPLSAVDRLSHPAIEPVPGVSPAVQRTIAKAMEMDPQGRFQDIDAFLENLHAREAAVPEPPPFIYKQHPEAPTEPLPRAEEPPPPARKGALNAAPAPAPEMPRPAAASGNNSLAWVIIAAGIAVVAIVLFLWLGSGGGNQMDRYYQAMEQGEGHLARKDYDRAIIEFEKALDYKEGDPQAEAKLRESRRLKAGEEEEKGKKERQALDKKARSAVASFFYSLNAHDPDEFLTTLADWVVKYDTWENMSKYDILKKAKAYWDNIAVDENTVDWDSFQVYEEADGSVRTTFGLTYYYLTKVNRDEKTMSLHKEIRMDKNFKIYYYD